MGKRTQTGGETDIGLCGKSTTTDCGGTLVFVGPRPIHLGPSSGYFLNALGFKQAAKGGSPVRFKCDFDLKDCFDWIFFPSFSYQFCFVLDQT